MKNRELRGFIRHPSSIPLVIYYGAETCERMSQQMLNVSLGGLSFLSDRTLPVGEIITVSIALLRPPFESKAKVVWCEEVGGKLEVGVEFVDAGDAAKARLVEQVCYIEQYRRETLDIECRQLTSEEAAHEWIDKYASL